MGRPEANPALTAPKLPSSSLDRRRGRRHKVLSPAYANQNGSSQGAVLELSAILNLSESGMCIQAPSQMKVDRLLPLGIDLAESGEHLHTVGQVAWSDATGKTGIRFPEMAEVLRLQLRHWLAANARTEAAPASERTSQIAEWEKIEKELEHCGGNVEAALHVIAQGALTLSSASGAAIALINPLHHAEMICRARAGTDSPDMGARFEAGAGFSGQCVAAGVTLKCDDSESDSRVDRESCGRLGIRSIVACPVKRDGEVMGILEVFSPELAAFGENDIAALERLAGMLERAAGRPEAKPAEVLSFPASDAALENSPGTTAAVFDEQEVPPPASWRRGMLLLLTALALVGGAVWAGARWVEARSARISSAAPAPASPAQAAVPRETYIGDDPKDLQVHADAGDAAAEYRLGMRYATGEDVKQDYGEAMRWFLRAADQGDVHAQATVAIWLMAGRGATQDYGQAYYWALLAQAGGDESGRAIVLNSAPYLSPAQTAAAQKRAEDWLHGHHIGQAADPAAQ